MRKLLVLLMIAVMAIGMCACGGGDGQDTTGGEISSLSTVSEDYFEWDGNTITYLTEKGLQQEELVIPARCESIDYRIMGVSEVLKKVSFESDKDIDLSTAFQFCHSLESIELPAQLSKIDDGAFEQCESLKEIIIPGSVKSIGEDAFYECKSLTNVVFKEGIEVIKEGAFSYCDSLSNVTFCDSITTIEDEAFCYDESLKVVSLPKNLRYLGNEAFSYCGFNVNIPEGVELID